ncbi:MAG: radical SAM protein [Candidatus Bathyarchaeota archaeon]
MGKCLVCSNEFGTISTNLGVCLRCIREKPEYILDVTRKTHAKSRAVFGLPPEPPRDPKGLLCRICLNNCKIGIDSCGFCGLVVNVDGHLIHYGGTAEKGVLEWYYDDLPTNCVGWWFCPGCTGKGYPQYAYKPEAEYGYANLAVFYSGCSYDCLYCQNWHHRNLTIRRRSVMSAENLVEKVDEHISCICFFGGDPSPQMPHSLEVSRIVCEKSETENRILRVCWETNGNMKSEYAYEAAKRALESGGNIKFDLKTWNEDLNIALCGLSNQASFKNFKAIGEKFYNDRSRLPLLSASTLLVPGYIDAEEIGNIAEFIGRINPNIPYTLLAFQPSYIMKDLSTTTRIQALECRKAAKNYLTNVRVGNVHLLS